MEIRANGTGEGREGLRRMGWEGKVRGVLGRGEADLPLISNKGNGWKAV